MKHKRQQQKDAHGLPLSQFSVQFPVLSMIVDDMLQNRAATSGLRTSKNRISVARIVDGVLQVSSGDLKRIEVPLASIPALAGKSPADLENFELDQDGACVSWPDCDVDLGWEQLQQIADITATMAARQSSRDFNNQRKKGATRSP